MKLIMTLIFVFFVVVGNAQDEAISSAHIIYKVINTITDKQKEEAFSNMRDKAGNKGVEMYKEIYRNYENIVFDLFIYNNQSKYAVQEVVPSEDFDKQMAYDMAVSIVDGNYTYFYSLLTQKLITQDMDDSQLYTIEVDKLYWKITDEKKQIQSYTCYKAIATDTFNVENDHFDTFEYYAWFTPEIPLSFGPNKAVGLPGLVLEANINKIHIVRAENITISSSAASADDIAMKLGGIEMTEKEANDMARKYLESQGID